MTTDVIDANTFEELQNAAGSEFVAELVEDRKSVV